MGKRLIVAAVFGAIGSTTTASAAECPWVPTELVEVDLAASGTWHSAMVKTVDAACVAQVVLLPHEGQPADDTLYTASGRQIRLIDFPFWAFGDGN
jgi:hypothetical protein